MNPRWKIVVLLLVVVLLSTAGGLALGRSWARAEYRRRSKPQAWNVEAMHTLERKLDLTATQREQVQRVIDGGVDDLIAIRGDALSRTHVVIDRLVAEIEPLLTTEQRTAFLKLKASRAQPSLEMLQVKPRPEASPRP